jgi:hypothetical protein
MCRNMKKIINDNDLFRYAIKKTQRTKNRTLLLAQTIFLNRLSPITGFVTLKTFDAECFLAKKICFLLIKLTETN